MPTAEYYNFGRSGSGNLMIASRVIEADMRFKFSTDDLVIVFWSTFCREDRWANGTWIHPGNIFSQSEYSKAFVKKYADPVGYLLRDINLLTMAYEYLASSLASAVPLMSVPFDYQQLPNSNFETVLDVYQPFIKKQLPSMFELELNNRWETGHVYYSNMEKGMFNDYHPSTDRYYRYLKKLNFNLTSASAKYTSRSMKMLKSAVTDKQLKAIFGDSTDWQMNSKLF
jgi:hypothetical protein